MTTAAWYLLKSESTWARWFNVIHFPYTGWHLSYVVLGACLADQLNLALLGWTLLAFFLGMGIAAHCFDLLEGDPLRLGIPRLHLWIVAGIALASAAGIGLWQLALGNIPWFILGLIGLGIIFAAGYSLEWPGLHGDWQFTLWWAGFPLIVSYLAQGLDFTPALIPVLIFALASATAQRVISTRARYLRRQVDDVSIMTDFAHCLEVEGETVGKSWMLLPLDRSLAWLSLAMVALALEVLAWRTM